MPARTFPPAARRGILGSPPPRSAMDRPSASRSTLPEALVAAAGLIGFQSLLFLGVIDSWQSVGLYSAMLGITVAFYFLLLLARAIHQFMVGGDTFWWEKYEEQERAKHAKKERA